jgi:hypothetical protein
MAVLIKIPMKCYTVLTVNSYRHFRREESVTTYQSTKCSILEDLIFSITKLSDDRSTESTSMQLAATYCEVHDQLVVTDFLQLLVLGAVLGHPVNLSNH